MIIIQEDDKITILFSDEKIKQNKPDLFENIDFGEVVKITAGTNPIKYYIGSFINTNKKSAYFSREIGSDKVSFDIPLYKIKSVEKVWTKKQKAEAVPLLNW